MIEAILASFRRCRNEKDFWRVQLDAEHRLTPAEFARLIEVKADLPSSAQAWLDKVGAIGAFGQRPIAGFQRKVLHDGVTLYSDGQGAARSKRLIIGFCGLAHQLMLPIPCMLQYLDPAQCDVLVLRDPDREHYFGGIGDYASSFPGLLERLRRDLPLASYGQVYCYGTSVGGAAALRAGLLLEADRAIAIGVSFPWHVSRLKEPAARPFPAFDPICDCWRETGTVLISAFGGANRKDREQSERLAAILPVRSIVFADVANHNLILELATSGRLDAFFARVFRLGKDLERRGGSRHGWRSRLPAWLGGRRAAGGGRRRRLAS